jgi:hypothetical protein
MHYIFVVTALQFCSYKNIAISLYFISAIPPAHPTRRSQGDSMLKLVQFRRVLLIIPLLFATSVTPAFSQHRGNQNYNSGMRNGGRGGNYNDDRNHRYNDRNNNNQGGIGPGKGALIGAGGGALLGALFGGGLKGAVIGGAAGAGVGAIAGQANQNSKDNRRRDRY